MERFSASVAKKHLACHASANLDKALLGWQPPVEDRTADNAANRGTSMHEMFAKVAELPPADMRNLVTAMQYLADLRSTRRFKVMIEQTVTATWLVGEPQTTADAVFYTQDEIHVIDLKTGKIPVEVVRNEQLMFGAVSYGHLAPKAKGVWCHILQPWADGCNSWFADTTVLNQFMADCQQAEKEIRAGDTTFMPGDHCMFCPAYPHARTAKGNIMCPATMKLLGYAGRIDEDEILSM